jgi:hypothetical protein
MQRTANSESESGSDDNFDDSNSTCSSGEAAAATWDVGCDESQVGDMEWRWTVGKEVAQVQWKKSDDEESGEGQAAGCAVRQRVKLN